MDGEMIFVMSLMKHKNKSGASIVPWGTPEETPDTEHFSQLAITCWVLPHRKFLTHSRIGPLIPSCNWLNLWQRTDKDLHFQLKFLLGGI